MQNFEFIVYVQFWAEVLSPINRCQKILQDPTAEIGTTSTSLKNLAESLNEKREDLASSAVKRAEEWCEDNEVDMNIKRNDAR